MRAVVFDGQLRLDAAYPEPNAKPGWARIRVSTVGICKTDMEITRGYSGFRGVLGHEFVGVVDPCEDRALLGKRVVGEINAACGTCDWCRRELGRHCPHRTTLGIVNHDGCMADYCLLPTANLIPVPAAIGNDRAVLVEPLAAACEILEQVRLTGSERAVILGDGRLGILCAWVLSTALDDVTLVGHHPEKLAVAVWRKIKTAAQIDAVAPQPDLVVEATGSALGIRQALAICRPRGTVVLKTTVAAGEPLNLAPLVVNELTIIGSRCGQFRDALRVMTEFPDMPLERLIAGRYPLRDALAGFAHAARPGVLKVLLDIG
ncbi:MAG: alcohol dehydrogenase [Lentisphaerae bacterium RIFOXYB12_FULL_65_16]|nr:MAG: alcohol dehydrogenase [Lentisphaerae bacterium RIFOXYA12_64_32]OGV87645.1 MAG: alcohol dehydrogenase [Lentisphaerae bacterium RIFOXYB12_FULL_65_16]